MLLARLQLHTQGRHLCLTAFPLRQQSLLALRYRMRQGLPLLTEEGSSRLFAGIDLALQRQQLLLLLVLEGTQLILQIRQQVRMNQRGLPILGGEQRLLHRQGLLLLLQELQFSTAVDQFVNLFLIIVPLLRLRIREGLVHHSQLGLPLRRLRFRGIIQLLSLTIARIALLLLGMHPTRQSRQLRLIAQIGGT